MKLVTGGGGYLGSHLARRLLEMGEPVRIFDVARTPMVPDAAEFMRGDMRDIAAVRASLRDVDVVFHLAFIQSLSKRPMKEKYEINIGGTDNFLRAALESGVRRFVHTSTIEVYGVRPPFPCDEDAPKDTPTGWYGRHKWECEGVCRRYLDQGLHVAMLRMPAICGPGHYNHGPFLDLMDRIIENRPVAVLGNGSIRGNMTHYQDVIDAYLLAAEKPEAVGEAFNIASDEPATHLEILKAMRDEAGSRSIIFRIPPPIAEFGAFLINFTGIADIPDHQIGYAFHDNHYSIEKAKRLLAYAPAHTVTECAREQIRSYRENREFVRQRNKAY